jgi:hypothetical protein
MVDGQAVSAAQPGLAFVLAPVSSLCRECDGNYYKLRQKYLTSITWTILEIELHLY